MQAVSKRGDRLSSETMASRNTLLRNLLLFLKADLLDNITDPIIHERGSKSSFVMTSYPQREVKYPLITIKITNLEAPRAGMQSTALDITMTAEIRIWARNQVEKDEIYAEVMDRLANIQFTQNGTENNDFHDFKILSSIEIDEPGELGIKSRILQARYKFYNYE
jgi:hypothetical protein